MALMTGLDLNLVSALDLRDSFVDFHFLGKESEAKAGALTTNSALRETVCSALWTDTENCAVEVMTPLNDLGQPIFDSSELPTTQPTRQPNDNAGIIIIIVIACVVVLCFCGMYMWKRVTADDLHIPSPSADDSSQGDKNLEQGQNQGDDTILSETSTPHAPMPQRLGNQSECRAEKLNPGCCGVFFAEFPASRE